MEGTLLVPPERGTIIGRAVWKSRFVVVANGQKEQQTNPTFAQSMTASRMQAASRASNIRAQPTGSPEAIYLSIYKSKIQHVAHRKQGPVLPTLIISISPDPTTDKLRKRRSSRTAGLTSTKETHPTTLWFRPGDDVYTLQDWARFIQPLIQPNMPDRVPMSPITPASPSFINPFSARREASDAYQRPSSGHANHWGPLHYKGSGHTHSSRERPLTFSEAPSLRSKRSDVSSSHASSMVPAHMGYQNYTAIQQGHVTDLPSPATTIGEYQGEFIEGWTSAQGRSSTLSSPTRGRDSVSSQGPQSIAVTMDSSSPPAPRETILDRAFQLRCIPGSERAVPGEEKLSSLARFDALMREADEKRKIREAEEARLRAESEPKSVWDLDDDSDSDDEGDDDDDSDDVVGELNDSELGYPMPSTAQRALNYIASRHDSQQGQRSRAQTGGRGPLNYNAETLMALNSGPSLLRPQTSYARNRPGMAQRTHSQPQLAGMGPIPGTLDSAPQPAGSRGSGDTLTTKASPLHRSQTEKRLSTSSAKRSSFTEFTKRLSSTSSLLLVQTNASSASAASSRGSSDTAGEGSQQHGLRGALQPRGVRSPTPRTERDSTDKACNWRGSVGVFGAAEGGLI
ncbi:hypothetical protein CONLIGDRAFT_575174 [Coniochaeta ligniaria NRRL 30616]|uniref:Uncharacterized protein n=1 Tax=Coniochaeta ligniaria NRRL 30616 TaxID=1408157 RepID=A0A1J7JID3_9PEZI|nr:hypothetical protein CONLIGDRAFT_575174 [Coniochaeta ligniaria NRRL 30616]